MRSINPRWNSLRVGCWLVLAAFWSGVSATAGAIPTVAIFEFEAREPEVREHGAKIATLLSVELAGTGDMLLVERVELDKLLGEAEFSASGAVGAESAAKLGGLLGAKVLVTGRLLLLNKQIVAVAKVMGVETGRVFPLKAQNDDLVALTGSLGRLIAETVRREEGALMAPLDKRLAELAALTARQAASGRKTTISVHVPETHYGAPASDPALETSLRKTLLEAGYEVLDKTQAGQSELELSGEAFSAFGFRRGNLVFCRGRGELKVVERASGRVLWSDAETQAAADISEQTSAKSALENVATGLALRALPRLPRH